MKVILTILLIWLLILSMCVIDIIMHPQERGYQYIDYSIKDGVLIPLEQGKQLNCVCKCTEGFERTHY